MSTDTYHTEIDPISKTQLNMFYEDPEQFYRTFVKREINPPGVGEAAEIGRIIHAYILERQPLSYLVQEIPEACLKSNGHINRPKLDEHAKMFDPAVYWLKSQQYEQVCESLRTADEVLAAIGATVNTAEFEREVRAEYMDVKIKCRADIINNGVELHDIKCSKNIDDKSFDYSAHQFRYWLQDIHYSATLAANRGISNPLQIPFTFWTIETVPPYRFEYRSYPQEDRERSLEEWEMMLFKYRHALESGRFETRRTHTVRLRNNSFLYDDELVPLEGAA